jgi:ADP-heptose:LPS heptosyltransferase
VDRLLERLPQGGRVAVIRLRSLGDCVLTTPALDILKRFRPDLHLAVVVEDRFRAIFEENPDIEAILPPGIGPLRGFRPDLCLNFHGGTRSAWMTALSGARFRAGFGHFRSRWAYNVRIPRAQEILHLDRTVHTAEHLASAIFYLGAPLAEIPRARLYTRTEPRSSGSEPEAIIHPAASTAAKAWPSDRFLAVARHLRECGIDPLFIGAAGDDLTPFREFRAMAGAPLSETKRLLASASLFIGNDSGPAHMAAAFGLPVIVVFGASNPAIWGPWRTASEIVASPSGISGVEVSQVIEALARLRVAA